MLSRLDGNSETYSTTPRTEPYSSRRVVLGETSTSMPSSTFLPSVAGRNISISSCSAPVSMLATGWPGPSTAPMAALTSVTMPETGAMMRWVSTRAAISLAARSAA